MSDDADVVVYRHYYTPGVKRVIASGSSAFIGEVDESTVLKYPLAPGGDVSRLEVERELLEIVGPHPRIIGLKSLSDTGLYLERAVNGIYSNQAINLLQPSNDYPGAERLLRQLHTSIHKGYFTAISSPQISSSTRSFISNCQISRESSYPKMEKSFWMVGVESPADSTSLEVTHLKQISRRTSLRSDAPCISS